jgi:hypothetical protein
MQEEADLNEPLVVAEERQRKSIESGFSSYCYYSCFLFLIFTMALRCLEQDDEDDRSQHPDGIPPFYYYLLFTAALHLSLACGGC